MGCRMAELQGVRVVSLQRVNFKMRKERKSSASAGRLKAQHRVCIRDSPLERDDERAEHVKEWLPPCTGRVRHQMPCAGRVRLVPAGSYASSTDVTDGVGRASSRITRCTPENSCPRATRKHVAAVTHIFLGRPIIPLVLIPNII